MNDHITGLLWAKRMLILMVLLPVLGCAQDYGKDTTTQPTPSQPAASPTTAPSPDARFVATEEQGVKVWKLSATPAVITLKNRGNKPLVLNVVNMLPAEHGFAIDSMKVQEVIKPGEERTITVPIANIDQKVPEHRVYCQLHPKHGAAALMLTTDQNQSIDAAKNPSPTPEQTQNIDAAKSQSKTQPGETSMRAPSESPTAGETEGQRMIRQQSELQREIPSTSQGGQTPQNLGPSACEGFPGFDRGCPRGGKQ